MVYLTHRSNLWGTVALTAMLVAAAACSEKAKFGGTSADKIEPVLILDQSFDAATLGTENTKFKPAFGTVEQSVTLKEKVALTDTQHQIYRTPLASPDQFQQGHAGSVTIQDFTISSAAKMDLLVVLDNSSSMASEQTLLSTGLPALVSGLSSIDWQIGIISSDSEAAGDVESNKGCHLYDQNGKAFDAQGNLTGAPIVKSDPMAAVKFTNTIQNLGVSGSNREQLIRNAYRAVSGTCGTTPQPWLRKDALLGILFVTDEDSFCESDDPAGVKDNGSNILCKANELPATLINYLGDASKFPTGQVRVYSLTYQGTMPLPTESKAQRPAARIKTVVNAFGGFDDSIIPVSPATDYSATLRRISADAATIVKRQFSLKAPPISDSLQVSVDGVLTTDFQLNGQMLSVSGLDASKVNLHVSYRHDPVPTFADVVLSKVPNLASMTVAVNDLPLTPDQYTYDAATNTIHFLTTPADYAVVRVNYRVGPDLKTDFTINGSTGLRPLKVTVDGTEITDYDWDPASTTVHFKVPPADSAVVTTSFKDPNGKITTYDQAPDTSATLSMDVTDAHSHEVLDVAENSGKLVFKADDVVDGRVATVTYHYADKTTLLTHQLVHAPLDGTVSLKIDDGSTDCLENIKINAQQVEFNCNADSLGEVNLVYQYLVSHETTFTINQDVPVGGYVQVFIDGQAYAHYIQDGRTFTIPVSDTTINSKVRVTINVDANGGVRH